MDNDFLYLQLVILDFLRKKAFNDDGRVRHQFFNLLCHFSQEELRALYIFSWPCGLENKSDDRYKYRRNNDQQYDNPGDSEVLQHSFYLVDSHPHSLSERWILHLYPECFLVIIGPPVAVFKRSPQRKQIAGMPQIIRIERQHKRLAVVQFINLPHLPERALIQHNPHIFWGRYRGFVQ